MSDAKEPTTSTTTVEEDSGKKNKRGAQKEMRREDVDDQSDDESQSDDFNQQQQQTWRRADEEILSQRKKVKVRRGASALVPENAAESTSLPSFSFATAPITTKPDTKETNNGNGTKEDAKAANEKDKDEKSTNGEEKKKEEWKSPFANFNPGTTLSSSTTPTFSFATSFSFSTSLSFAPSTISATSSTTTPASNIWGLNIAPPTSTSFAPPFVTSKSEDSSETPEKTETSTSSPSTAEPTKTGEEDEEHVFQTRSKLFVLDTSDNKWHERGIGQFRVNVAKDGSSARLLMRIEGSLRLILNMPIYSSIKIERAGDKAVRFIGQSMEKEGTMAVYSLRVASKEIVDQLITAVETNKAPTPSDKKDEEDSKDSTKE